MVQDMRASNDFIVPMHAPVPDPTIVHLHTINAT